jgi:hypothetical protein
MLSLSGGFAQFYHPSQPEVTLPFLESLQCSFLNHLMVGATFHVMSFMVLISPPCWKLWRVFRNRVSRTICPGWPRTAILLISASWVARITGVSHQHLAHGSFLMSGFQSIHLQDKVVMEYWGTLEKKKWEIPGNIIWICMARLGSGKWSKV